MPMLPSELRSKKSYFYQLISPERFAEKLLGFWLYVVVSRVGHTIGELLNDA